MKCLTWNLEWASPASKRLGVIQQRIAGADPDVVCYTEVLRSVLPGGYTIEADADYGYSNTGEKRKVVLWSKHPWTDVDRFGDPKLPSGRYASGVTGGVRFVGVCIPWRDAHVKTGRKDREPWEDHLSYCHGLGDLLERYARCAEPICVFGDFNQRIPRTTQPEHVFEALLSAIPKGFRIHTEGLKDAEGNRLIDHLAVSPALEAHVEEILPRFAPDGTRLSDHVGLLTKLKLEKANPKRSG